MKTAREYWEVADEVASRVRRNPNFDMKLVAYACGSPGCLGGEVCVAMGRQDLLRRGVEVPLVFAGKALGILKGNGDYMHDLFNSLCTGWDVDLKDRYRDGDRQESAIEAMYREVEKAHGPRPADEPTPTPVYEIPDWRRVVREIQMEEAEGVGA